MPMVVVGVVAVILWFLYRSMRYNLGRIDVPTEAEARDAEQRADDTFEPKSPV